MSVPTTISAITVPLAFSTDNITFKSAVCLKVWNVNLDIATTEEDTQCGILVAEGAKKTDFDFEVIANLTPSGATQISAKEIMGYWDARTAVYVRVQPGTGMNILAFGKLYNIKASAAAGTTLFTITGTFKASGDPTIS
jgi:hypothetical protein